MKSIGRACMDTCIDTRYRSTHDEHHHERQPMKASHTPPRSVRVPDDVWQAAKDEAARRGESVTDAVVRFLVRYGKSYDRR